MRLGDFEGIKTTKGLAAVVAGVVGAYNELIPLLRGGQLNDDADVDEFRDHVKEAIRLLEVARDALSPG